MTTIGNRGSARLYEFPKRVPTTLDGHRSDAKPVVDANAPKLAETAFGSGWYHDEAVKESERTRKH
jgi:hypothetical protein